MVCHNMRDFKKSRIHGVAVVCGVDCVHSMFTLFIQFACWFVCLFVLTQFFDERVWGHLWGEIWLAARNHVAPPNGGSRGFWQPIRFHPIVAPYSLKRIKDQSICLYKGTSVCDETYFSDAVIYSRLDWNYLHTNWWCHNTGSNVIHVPGIAMIIPYRHRQSLKITYSKVNIFEWML